MMKLTIIVQGGVLALALALAYFLKINLEASIIFDTLGTFIGVGSGVVIALGVVILDKLPVPFLKKLQSDFSVLVVTFKERTLLQIFILSAIAGITEEVLFRGVLQTAITDYSNIFISLGITALLFGIMHFISKSYFLYIMVVSITFGLLLIATENLLVPVLAHATFDFVALTYGRYFRFN